MAEDGREDIGRVRVYREDDEPVTGTTAAAGG